MQEKVRSFEGVNRCVDITYFNFKKAFNKIYNKVFKEAKKFWDTSRGSYMYTALIEENNRKLVRFLREWNSTWWSVLQLLLLNMLNNVEKDGKGGDSLLEVLSYAQ